jgi:hypothetical protein
MLTTHRTAIGLMIIALGSIAAGRLAYAQSGGIGKSGPSAIISSGERGANGMFQQAAVDGRAPVGHRQPRQRDISSADAALSLSDRALQQEDGRIDKKLFICRGC